jgi:hypothetical protein
MLYGGVVIHDTECRDCWARRLEGSGLNLLGVHPAGGGNAHRSLAECAEYVKTPQFSAFRKRMNRAGIAVEFEMHALSWLLPRELFSSHPAWFREENGARTSRFNCCATDNGALEFVAGRAAELARIFPSDTHRYHFWLDDVGEAKCSCPGCRHLTASDQALAITNAIADGVRRADSRGRTAYLAYRETLVAPVNVRPAPGVFLEFAPIGRDFDHALFDPSNELNAGQVQHLPALLDIFGREDAKALDYWIDNSLFSKWTKPPRQFALNAEVCRADVAEYRRLGFASVTSFGCFLGEEYEALWGAPRLEDYFSVLRP